MEKFLEEVSPEKFEELAKDLLQLDGFTNVQLHSAGSDDGVDLTANKGIVIGHNRQWSSSWMIQCKHSKTNRSLGRSEVVEIINDFESDGQFDGLLIITNRKLSPSAFRRLQTCASRHKGFAFCWDVTDIRNFFESHPFLKDKHQQGHSSSVLEGASKVSVLLLSDGSVFAYHVYDTLRIAGFQVKETRLHQYGANVLSTPASEMHTKFDLAIVFLAEMYWSAISAPVIEGLRTSIESGMAAIFTPFCAWSVEAGMNERLADLLPVSAKPSRIETLDLIFPAPPDDLKAIELSPASYSGTFIENQPMVFRTKAGKLFTANHSFEGRSTYEFVEPKPGTQVLVRDTNNTPILAAGQFGKGVTIYFNMCAHNCMAAFPMRSPLEEAPGLSRVVAETVLWAGSRGG